jgi:hypothetical protein
MPKKTKDDPRPSIPLLTRVQEDEEFRPLAYLFDSIQSHASWGSQPAKSN